MYKLEYICQCLHN